MSAEGRFSLALRVALAQSGDRKALDRLLSEHQRALYHHVRAILRDGDLSYDVLQSVLLLITRRLTSLKDPRWFRAWAFRIATREAVRAAKRRSRDRQLFDEDAEGESALAPISEAAYDIDLANLCADRLDDLPPGARLVLRLHYLEELSLAEVAEALEIPVGTAKSRLAYGLALLRSEMAGQFSA